MGEEFEEEEERRGTDEKLMRKKGDAGVGEDAKQ